MGPLQAVAVTALLWMETGISCLAGMSVLIFFFCFCKTASGCCFHHSGKRNTGFKKGNIYLVISTVCSMLLFKNKMNAFSGLFFAQVADPSGLASRGSSLKLKADVEAGKVTALAAPPSTIPE